MLSRGSATDSNRAAETAAGTACDVPATTARRDHVDEDSFEVGWRRHSRG